MQRPDVLQRLRRVRERLRRIEMQQKMPKKRILDISNPLEKYSVAEFKARFHLLKETALFIVDLVAGDLSAPLRRGVHIPPLLQFLIVQRYFATNAFQLVIGDLNGLPPATVSILIKRVAKALCKHRSKFIRWPTFDEALENRVGFLEIGGFPGVVGCIDGTHCGIKNPGGDTAELFRNRKQSFSVNVQIVCDHKLNIINLVARWYGSAHDMRIFENSVISSQLENNQIPGILLGDAGYACLPYLLTPYPSPSTPPQKKYNKAQLKTRNCAERAIGCWKKRFPILCYCRLKLKTTLMVIVACGTISNIARRRCDLLENDEVPIIDAVPPEPCNTSSLNGRAKREEIILTHFA